MRLCATLLHVAGRRPGIIVMHAAPLSRLQQNVCSVRDNLDLRPQNKKRAPTGRKKEELNDYLTRNYTPGNRVSFQSSGLFPTRSNMVSASNIVNIHEIYHINEIVIIKGIC